MAGERLIRLAPSAAVKEKRLREARGEGFDRDPALQEAVRQAQALGTLELAGLEPLPDALAAVRRGQQAVDPAAPVAVAALLAWHAALTGRTAGFRQGESTREGDPPPAPAAFIESRLATLQQWLAEESARELAPGAAGALVMARVVEVRPFDEANGRVARLAASHAVVRAGGRPPVLNGADAARLQEALRAAFQLHTEPLARLLDEASERALDAMLAALTR
ncbi:MAG TPA: Fic family protein [Vicinamibacteria bacterium]|nr:Fic family protein [Vicinamibacteria bacterium]